MSMRLSVADGHLCNMGRMIEEMESKLRNSLDQVIFLLSDSSFNCILVFEFFLFSFSVICSLVGERFGYLWIAGIRMLIIYLYVNNTRYRCTLGKQEKWFAHWDHLLKCHRWECPRADVPLHGVAERNCFVSFICFGLLAGNLSHYLQ